MRRFMAMLPIFAIMLFAACSDDTPASGGELPGDRGETVTDEDAAGDAADARTDVVTTDARSD